MDQDQLTFINSQINYNQLKKGKWTQHNFNDYFHLHKILLKNQPNNKTKKTLKIYDITHNKALSHNTIVPINDHINRIGENPFIGKQNFFEIDFINIENLHIQNLQGVITNSCGIKYNKQKTKLLYPSTQLANIAVMAHVYKYQIKAYLVNQLIEE